MVSDIPFFLLSRLDALPHPAASTDPERSADFARPLTEVAGTLLDQPMRVLLAHQRDESLLQFADGTTATISADGGVIRVVQQGAQLSTILFGPALILALARHGIFCLHASAFRRVDGQVWLALANSGIGKSTLARTVEQHGGERLCDDLCAVSLAPDGRLLLWPRFPQLKWCAAQHRPETDGALPVDGLALLSRGPVCRREPLREPSLVVRALLGHSVATRLFEPRSLAAHLTFAAQSAEVMLRRNGVARWIVAERPQAVEGAMLELLAAQDSQA